MRLGVENAGSAKIVARAPFGFRCLDGARLQGNLDLQKGIQDQLLQSYRKAANAVLRTAISALSTSVNADITIFPISSCARKAAKLICLIRYFSLTAASR